MDSPLPQVTGYLFFYYETAPQQPYLMTKPNGVQPDIDTWLDVFQRGGGAGLIANLYRMREPGAVDEEKSAPHPEWNILDPIKNSQTYLGYLRLYTGKSYRVPAGTVYSATNPECEWHLSHVLTIKNAVRLMKRYSPQYSEGGVLLSPSQMEKLFLMSADPSLTYKIMNDKFQVTHRALTSDEFRQVSENYISYIYRHDPAPPDGEAFHSEDTKEAQGGVLDRMKSCVRPFGKCFPLSFSMVHPLAEQFMNLAMPHIREQISYNGTLFKSWKPSFIEAFRLQEGRAPTEEETKMAYADYYSSLGGESSSNFIVFLNGIRESTDISDPMSRAGAFQRATVLLSPEAPVGNTYRAVMKYIQDLHKVNPRHHLQSHFGFSGSDGLSGLTARLACFECEVAESALRLNNLHREFVLAQRLMDGASIPWPNRTQTTMFWYGSTTTGKTYTAKMVQDTRIGDSMNQVTYATGKAAFGTGNDAGSEVYRDDVAGDDYGVDTKSVQTVWAIYQRAAGRSQSANTVQLANLKAELSNIYQTVITAGVTDNGRINRVARSIKYGSRLWNTNSDPRMGDEAILARAILVYIGSYNRNDLRAPASSMLQESDTLSHPLAKVYKEQNCNRQAIINVWNIMSLCGAMPPPSIKWAGTWLDAFLRVYESSLGFRVRMLRAINILQQFAHIHAQQQAITAYFMGLAERPDMEHPFRITDLDGLSHYAVAGLDSLVFIIDLMGALVDSQLFQVCIMLRRFSHWYAKVSASSGGKIEPMYDTKDGYFVFPHVVLASNGSVPVTGKPNTAQTVEAFLDCMMNIPQAGSGTSVLNRYGILACLGQFLKPCIIEEGRMDATKPGVIVRSGEICLHRRLFEIGLDSDDPVQRSILACVPLDWPEQRVLRGRWDPRTTEFMPITLRQNIAGHPDVRHLYRKMLKASGQYTYPVDYSKIPEYLSSPDPIYRRFQDAAEKLKTVRICNQGYIDGTKAARMSSAAPAAFREISEKGLLRQSQTIDVSYASYLESYREHLLSLGVKDPLRHAAYPPNLEECTRAYGKVCDALKALVMKVARVRLVYSQGGREKDPAEYFLALDQMTEAVIRASLLLIDMFVLFRYYKNYDRWQVHGEKSLNVDLLLDDGSSTTTGIKILQGIRMSDTNVSFYLTPYFQSHEEMGLLPVVLRTMAWIAMQNKHSEKKAVTQAMKDAFFVPMIRWFAADWRDNVLPKLAKVDGPSIADPLVYSSRRMRSGPDIFNTDDLPPEDDEEEGGPVDMTFASLPLYEEAVEVKLDDAQDFDYERPEEKAEDGKEDIDELVRQLDAQEYRAGEDEEEEGEEEEEEKEDQEEEEEKEEEDQEEEEEEKEGEEGEEEKEEEEDRYVEVSRATSDNAVFDENTQMPESSTAKSSETRKRKIEVPSKSKAKTKSSSSKKRQKRLCKFAELEASLSGEEESDEYDEGEDGKGNIADLIADDEEEGEDEHIARLALFREQSDNTLDDEDFSLSGALKRIQRPRKAATPAPARSAARSKYGFSLLHNRNAPRA